MLSYDIRFIHFILDVLFCFSFYSLFITFFMLFCVKHVKCGSYCTLQIQCVKSTMLKWFQRPWRVKAVEATTVKSHFWFWWSFYSSVLLRGSVYMCPELGFWSPLSFKQETCAGDKQLNIRLTVWLGISPKFHSTYNKYKLFLFGPNLHLKMPSKICQVSGTFRSIQ